MKKIVAIVWLSLFIGLVCFEQPNAAKTVNRQPVLVELFTSVSCFSCPPAEKMLTELESGQPFENAELITLEFHVDYRDGFGRKDVYASPLFTQRQRVYDRKFRTGKIYTPQMVVDGTIEFPGSNFKKAKKAVKRTVKNKKANIDLAMENERLKVSISEIPEHQDATIYLAISEDGLKTRNSSKSVNNVSIVRRLIGMGRIMPGQNSIEIENSIQQEEGWKKENTKYIVFIQENSSRRIIGVSRKALSAF